MTNPLKKSEVKWGSIYAVIQFFLLGDIALILKLAFDIPVWILQMGIFALNFLCTLIIFRHFLYGNLMTAVQKPGRVIGFTLLGIVLHYLSTFLVSFIILMIRPDYLNLNDATISEMSQQSGFWMLVGTVLLVPVAEECVFRGLLFRGFYDRSPILAWGLSVGLFSAVHILGYIGLYDPIKLLLAFLQYLPAGMCLAFVYKKTDTILTPILMHTCINLIGMSLTK